MRRHARQGIDRPGATFRKTGLAKALRRNATAAERELWEIVRRRALGWRFRRQHPIAGFIVDFYCPALRLAVEVDGEVHEQHADYDSTRDAILGGLGITVLRVKNDEVLAKPHVVEEAILRIAARISPQPPPPAF